MPANQALKRIRVIAQTCFGLKPHELDTTANILELGFDSLMIIKLGQEIERSFGVSLSARWFLSARPSLEDLARHLADQAPALRPEAAPPAEPVTAPAVEPAGPAAVAGPVPFPCGPVGLAGSDPRLELFSLQMSTMHELFAAQWAALGGEVPSRPLPAAAPPVAAPMPQAPARLERNFRGFVLEEPELTAAQARFVEELVNRHLLRTAESRRLGRENPTLADWKSTLAYRRLLKAAAYPIVADRTYEGRFTDVDGNDYLDISLGMGVAFLGHNPPYVVEAVKKRLERGYGLGPQCDLTAQAARAVAELTGQERVCFCNTGSEAVMFALRLARAGSGRDLVALFNGAYHGIFDGVLAAEEDGRTGTYSPGTPLGMVADTLVLDYDSDQALEILAREAHRLAAVLVEPVQSRKPGLQPGNFLRKLRRLTRAAGVCLIFDEMVNGFRIAPGGAQEHFGVRADLALYGKIIGGGLPVGVISGSARWLDHIDGGYLQDGREFEGRTIVFGGTFCRHPLSMEAVAATCEHLRREGPELQARAGRMTDELADRLNLWFQQNQVPLRLRNFGPQFIFESYGPFSAFANPLELTLFYMILQERGVWVWERRTCGLSTRHTPAEIIHLEQAVKDGVAVLRQGGFDFRLDRGAPELFASLTATQERLFALFQRKHGQDAYHQPMAWRLEGPVEAEALEIALGDLINEHESLRTGFHHLGEHLVTKVEAEVVFHLETGRDLSEADDEQLMREFVRPFDLARPPLLRAALIERDGYALFLLDVLHIAADGASLGLMLEDLNRLMRGGRREAPAPRFRRAQAALDDWLAEKPEGALSRRALDAEFWVARLADLPPLDLPLDFPAQSGSPRGGQRWFTIDAPKLNAYKKAAGSLGLTLNMFLSGVYVLLLHKFTGQDRLCLGLAHGGRLTPETEGCVGMFVNTVPQVFDLNPEQTAAEFFSAVRHSTLEAMEHAAAPYGDLTQALGRSPVQTMLSYEKVPRRNPDWPGVAAVAVAAPTRGAQYDLALDLVEADDRLHGNLIYSEAFRPGTAESLEQCFLHLADLAAQNPAVSIRRLDPLDPNQAPLLLQQLTRFETRPEAFDLLERLAATAEKEAERTAVVCADQAVSYGELWRRSGDLAERLKSLGAGPEKVVALALPRSIEYVAACLGVLRAGAAFMSLGLDSPPERLVFQCRDLDAVALISSEPSLFEGLDPSAVLTPAEALAPWGGPRMLWDRTAPNDPAYVLPTSGSTGRPKAVMIEGHSLANLCRWYLSEFQVTAADRFSAFSPFVFDASLWEIFPPLLAGAELHILTEEIRHDLDQLTGYLARHRITVCYLLSQVAEMLPGENLPDLRLLLSGGDVLHLDRPRGGYRHYNTYGPTEFTVTSHFHELDGQSPVPIGRPVAQSQGLVLDGEGRLCPVGRPGELCLSGPQLARGYLNQPELTARAFRPNPMPPRGEDGRPVPGFERMYRTGDRCRILAGGDIEFMGRLDRQYKIRGQRVEPGEIEKVLLEHPGVRQAVVLKREDQSGAAFLWAYVAADGQVSAADLNRLAARRLPAWMIPAGFTLVDELPAAASGKVDRAALEKLGGPDSRPGAAGRPGSDPPQTREERVLAEIWAAELGRDHIGRDDNFFALGGDSIKALLLTSRIRAAGYQIETADFFREGTLAELAARLQPLAAEKGRPAPATARPSDPFEFAPAELTKEDRANLLARFGDDLEAVLPLSPMQRGIVAHILLRGEDEAYIEQTRLTLTGELDGDLLTRRLRAVLAAHDIFRFNILGKEVSGPCQVLRRTVPSLAEVWLAEDWRDRPEADREKRLEEVLGEHRRALADTGRGALIRLALMRVGDQAYELVASAHHALTDAWSIGVFFQELLGEEQSAATAAPASFADHVRRLALRDPEEARDFWRDQLQDLTEATRLPGSSASGGPSGQLRVSPLTPGPALEAALTQAAAANKISLNTFLQTAWVVLVSRLCRQNRVVLAEVLAGRSAEVPGMEGLMGPCSVTVPLRLDCAGDTPFVRLAERLQSRAARVAAYDYLPLSEILKFSPLGPETLTHIFNCPPPKDFMNERPGLKVIQARDFSRAGGFDLAVNWERRPRLEADLVYDPGIFDDWQIESLGRAYLNVLAEAARRPEALASDLALSPPPTVRDLAVNAPAVDYPDETVVGAFRRQAGLRSEAAAVSQRGQTWSYGHLDQLSDEVAANLKKLGAGPGRRVALLFERGPHYAAALLGVMKSGAAAVPMSPELPAERLLFQLRDSAPVLALCDQGPRDNLVSAADRLPELILADASGRVIRGPAARSGGEAAAGPSPDDPVYVLYTSGSTGHPKGVEVGHRAIYNHSRWFADFLELAPGDTHSCFAAFTFDVSMLEILIPLTCGARVLIFIEEERRDLAALARTVRDEGVTSLWLPPQMALLYVERYPLTGLKTLNAGGDRLSPGRPLENFGSCRLINGYGPTECAVTTSAEMAEPGRWPTTIGRPGANCPAYILDEYGHPLPDGFPGELHIGGVQVARGYLNRPELNRQAFVPDPFAAVSPPQFRAARLYRTGDLARRRPDGRLEFLGRLDGQIKLRGYRLEPGEVEKCLLRHPLVSRAVVIKREDQPGSPVLCAYVVAADGIDEAGLKEFLGGALPAWMCPDRLIFMPELPVTANGKIDLQALPRPESEVAADFRPPTTEAEKALALALGEVLRRDRLGLSDGFLPLGGDSIKAIMAASRLEKAGWAVEAAAFYRAATLADLAAELKPLAAEEPAAPGTEEGWRDPGLSPDEEQRLKRHFQPAEIEAAHRLGPIQESMLLSGEDDADRKSYLIFNLAEVAGPLEIERLSQRFQALTRRHQALRSAFVLDGFERPWQVALTDRLNPFTYSDLSHLSAEGQRQRLDDLRSAAPAPKLDRDPLFGLHVFKIGPERHWLLLVWHHLILDGWSQGLLTAELLADDDSAVSAPPPFSRYLQWLDRRDGDEARQWWRQALAGAEEASTLAWAPSGLTVASPGSEPPGFVLSGELTRKLRALCVSRRVTPANVLQSALALLLARYNGRPTQVFGQVVSGRAGLPAELENVVGICVNTVPTLVECREEQSFVDLVGQVQGFSLEAQKRAFLPLAEIRAVSGLDLGDILFVMENQPVPPASGGLALKPLEGWGRTGLGLAVEWIDDGDRPRCRIHMESGRHDPALAARLAGHYQHLLAGLLNDPDGPVGRKEILDEAEQAAILEMSSGRLTDFSDFLPQSFLKQGSPVFPRLFELAAEANRDRVALWDGPRPLRTYGQLEQTTANAARKLRALGAGAEKVAGLLLPRGVRYAEAALAALRSGAAFLPLDPSLPPDRLSFMIQDADCCLLVSREEDLALAQELAGGRRPILTLADLVSGESEIHSEEPLPEVKPDQAAYVIYTSGSTGRPKGVVIEQAGLANLCLWQIGAFALTPRDIGCLYAPVGFDASVYEMFPPLACGASLAAPADEHRLDGGLMFKFFSDLGVTTAFLPPQVGKAVLAEGVPPYLRTLTLAGEKPGRLEPGPEGLTILNAYGPTEFTVCSASFPVEAPEDAPPIGRSVDNSQNLLLDDSGRLRPQGLVGEICLAGPQTARGYLNLPDQTEAVFTPHPLADAGSPFRRIYRTGDLGYYDGRGRLNFVGRKDNQIKVRGQRLEPGEIERVIVEQPAVNSALVRLARPADNGPELLTAYVLLAPGAEASAVEEPIRAALAAELPGWMMPAAFVYPDRWPLGRNGKIDPAALPRPPSAAGAAGPEGDARLEHLPPVLAAWAEVLGFKPGLDDHFLEIGGDSIKAMQVVARLRGEGFAAGTGLLFSHPTPRLLAEALVRAGADEAEKASPVAPEEVDPELEKIMASLGADRVEEYFGLTPLQEGLLFHHLLDLRSAAYIEQSLLLIEGRLDPQGFADGLGPLAERHQALRTVFAWRDLGRPRQIVLKDLKPGFAAYDWSGRTEAEQNQGFDELLAGERNLFADPDRRLLENGPLLRFALVRLGESRWVLAVTFHHLILDGWSLGLLLDELLALAQGRPLPAGPAPRFSDHVRRLEIERQPQVLARHREYWRDYLSGLKPQPFPGRKKTSEPGFYRDLPLNLSGELGPLAVSLARELRVTPATVLQSAWAVLMSLYHQSGQAGFGLVWSGRRPEEDGAGTTVGLFVATLPRLIKCPGEESFANLAGAVERDQRAAEDHSAPSFGEMLKAAGCEGPAEELIDHLFVMENLPDPAAPDDLKIRPGRGRNFSGYDFSVVMQPEIGPDGTAGLSGKIQFNPLALDEGLVIDLARRYEYVLRQALADPARAVETFRLLDEVEENRILALGRGPEARPPEKESLGRLLRLSAEKHAAKTALVHPAGSWTYEELQARADEFGRGLADFKTGPGHLVALLVPRSPGYLAALWSVVQSEAAYLPLDVAWPEGRLADILADADPHTIIVDQSLAHLAQYLSAHRLVADGGGAIAATPGQIRAATLPAETANIIYTSGSTGRPKGVLVRKSSFDGFCQWHRDFYQVTENDRSAMLFGPAFDAAAWGLFPLFLAGGQVHLPPAETRGDAVLFQRYCREWGVTLANVPTVLAEQFQLLDPPPGLRLLTCGGDALKRWEPRPYKLYNEYGPSETTIMVTCHLVTEPGPPIPIGRPLAGVHCQITDAQGRVRPTGLPGEIRLSGPQLALGYLNRPEETARAFVPNLYAGDFGSEYRRCYRTGDLGLMRADGVIEFLGRLDDQLSLAGHRVEPGEIEARIMDLPEVESAAVLPLTDGRGDVDLAAYVLRRADVAEAGPDSDQLLIQKIRDHLEAKLSAPMRPRFIVPLAAWPLTANGKLDRRALPDPRPADQEAGGEAEPPASALEMILAQIFREVLGLDQVGLDDDFFALGGDSIKAVRLTARLEASLGWSPSVADLLAGSTIRSLAAALAADQSGSLRTLIRLRGGSGPALVLVPTVGGSILCYRDLLDSLPPGRAVYALNPLLAEGAAAVEAAPPDRALESLMSQYRPALLETFPDGECLLLGLCMGGLSGWELARQMLESGVRVRGLVAVNTRTHLLTDEEGRGRRPEDMAAPGAEDIDRVIDSQTDYEGREPVRDEALKRHVRAQLLAWGHYRPGPADLQLVAVRPRDPYGREYLPFENRPLGWEELALGGFREVFRPGHHFSLMQKPLVPNLAELVEEILGEPKSPAASTVPLSPIQRWYLESKAGEGFFQSVVLQSDRPRPPERYRLALEALIINHPMLRAFYPLEDGSRVQRVARRGSVDFAVTTADGLAAALEKISGRFRLAAGPMVLAALVPAEAGEKSDRLALRIHHLVVDGVSWRLIALDFNRALELLDQLDRDGASPPTPSELAPKLPGALQAARGSFAGWVTRLEKLALDRNFQDREITFWRNRLTVDLPPLIALLGGSADGREIRGAGSYAALHRELDETRTRALVAASGRRGGAGLQALMLAAAVRAARDMAGAKGLRVLLEGHGRENLFEDCDPSAVVGWFTNLVPLVLSGRDDWAAAVQEVADSLAAPGYKGLGFSLLRRLSGLDSPPDFSSRADLLFNYLGEVPGPSGPPPPLAVTGLGLPGDVPPDLPQEADFSLTAHIQGGRLKTVWEWPEAALPRARVEELAEKFERRLAEAAGATADDA